VAFIKWMEEAGWLGSLLGARFDADAALVPAADIGFEGSGEGGLSYASVFPGKLPTQRVVGSRAFLISYRGHYGFVDSFLDTGKGYLQGPFGLFLFLAQPEIGLSPLSAAFFC